MVDDLLSTLALGVAAWLQSAVNCCSCVQAEDSSVGCGDPGTLVMALPFGKLGDWLLLLGSWLGEQDGGADMENFTGPCSFVGWVEGAGG